MEYTEVDELDIFLGKNYVVTHHDHSVSAVDETWEACHRDERNLQAGADHLLYKLTDNLVAGYMPAVEKIDNAIDQIEDQIFDRPSPKTINNRMNEVMKTLTIITTLFMPLTFVTGFFGMNFFEPLGLLKGWTTTQVFYVVLAINVLLPIVMYIWMRRRTWV